MKKTGSYLLAILAIFIMISAGEERDPTPLGLKYNPRFTEPIIPSDNPLTDEGVWLGRLLFYDKMLSGNNSQSCASCHQQQYAFTDHKKVAQGAMGDTVARNTMSLINAAWQHEFFWDGRIKTLEQLMPNPISHPNEMAQDTSELLKEINLHKHYPKLFAAAFPQQPIQMNLVSKALAQFVRTIITKGINLPDSVLPAYTQKGMAPAPEEMSSYLAENSMRGMFFRFSKMCSDCHDKKIYGGVKMGINGLKVNDTLQPMKAPSLINALLTAPYMHDGRFNTLKEVMLHYKENIGTLHTLNPHLVNKPLPNLITDYDVENIERFFALLTDSSMLTNEAYEDPFTSADFDWTLH
jgi:cytochrome c peroxidase